MADFDEIENMTVARSERDSIRTVQLDVSSSKLQRVSLAMLADDVKDFVALIEGYYRVCVDMTRTLLDDDTAPSPSTTAERECARHQLLRVFCMCACSRRTFKKRSGCFTSQNICCRRHAYSLW